MKKTYLLNIEGKNPDRLLDAAKHDIRKYIKRERAKTLPAGADFWDFACKAGVSESDAVDVALGELINTVNVVVKQGADRVYVEVWAKPGHRTSRSTSLPPDEV